MGMAGASSDTWAGLAEADGACLDEPRHYRGAARGPVGECRAGRRGLETGDVDVVFDGERHAVERQRTLRRFTVRVRGGEACQRDELRVERGCVGQRDPQRGRALQHQPTQPAMQQIVG